MSCINVIEVPHENDPLGRKGPICLGVCEETWEFPETRGTLLGVPIISIVACWRQNYLVATKPLTPKPAFRSFIMPCLELHALSLN